MNSLALAHRTGVRLAEVGFLLILFAGVWLAAAQARALKFENFKLEIKAKAGAEGKLFGSIGTADIAEAAVQAGQPITRSEVRMPTGPIRVTGEHQVQLHLHTDVDVTLAVTIVAEE